MALFATTSGAVSRIRLLYWIASAAAPPNRINITIRFYCLSICQQSLGFINALIMGRGGTPTAMHFVNIIYGVVRGLGFSEKLLQGPKHPRHTPLFWQAKQAWVGQITELRRKIIVPCQNLNKGAAVPVVWEIDCLALAGDKRQ